MSTELDSENFMDLFRQLKAKRFKPGEPIFNLGIISTIADIDL